MTRVIQFAFCLVLVAASNGLPVEEQAPLVVDIPAAPSASANREEAQKPIKEPELLSSDDDSVEILPIATSQDSDEIDTVGSGIHSIFDLFNLNRPRPQTHPLFVFHRRPSIRDPFADVLEDRDESVVRPTQDVFVREQQRPTQTVFDQQPTNSFDFMRHMDAMMQRVHQQLNNFMGFAHSHFQPRPVAPIAPRPHSNFRPIFPSFFDIHRNENETDSSEIINVDSLPANYTNSTSEVKEIFGQQFQVNKTIKRVSNGNGSSFFQISVVNYKPRGTTDKPAVAVEAEPTPAASEVVTKGPETVQVTQDVMKSEDPVMNEIDNQRSEETVSGIDDGLLDAGNNIPVRI